MREGDKGVEKSNQRYDQISINIRNVIGEYLKARGISWHTFCVAANPNASVIRNVNIGGGAAVEYTSIEESKDNIFSAYAIRLKEVVPELFDGGFRCANTK